MSGRSTAVCGTRRGYVLTDGAAMAHVARIITDSPKRGARRLGDREMDVANRSPHLLRADAAGAGVLLVLTVLNGVEQAVLVERRGTGRTMTCVPVRFDAELYHETTVMSGALVRDPRPTLVLEDVLRIGAGVVASASAAERAHMVHHLVHDRHAADLVLQPFVVQCARYMVPDASACRDAWRSLPYATRSVVFCPMSSQYPDMYCVLAADSKADRPETRPKHVKPPVRKLRQGNTVSVVPSDAPDVYSIDGGTGTLVVKTLADSHSLAATAKTHGHTAFNVPATYDRNTGRWIYSAPR